MRSPGLGQLAAAAWHRSDGDGPSCSGSGHGKFRVDLCRTAFLPPAFWARSPSNTLRGLGSSRCVRVRAKRFCRPSAAVRPTNTNCYMSVAFGRCRKPSATSPTRSPNSEPQTLSSSLESLNPEPPRRRTHFKPRP